MLKPFFQGLTGAYDGVPAGASIKQIFHYTQMIIKGDFSQYDYGSSTNLVIYGNDIAPAYNLTRISAPINLYYSEHDGIVTTENVFRIQSQLNRVKSFYLDESHNFSHGDFVLGEHAKRLVFDQLIYNLNETFFKISTANSSGYSQYISVFLQYLTIIFTILKNFKY